MTEMTPKAAYLTIKRTLEAERQMRIYVFQRYPEKRAQKIAEIDRALRALEVLKPEMVEQGVLL